MEWVTIVAMLALLEYIFFSLKAGQARGKYGVLAPAVTGHEMFERYYRVQMNTVEQLVVFLPALYAFAVFVSAAWAATLGALFVVGRGVYYFTYVRDPASRGTGMLLTMLSTLGLLIGALVGAALAL